MKNKSWFKNLYTSITLSISGAIGVGLIVLLNIKNSNNQDFESILMDLTPIFIGFSGFLSAILMIFLAHTAMNQKYLKAQVIRKISKTTQKMHHFRTIAELLIKSNIWMPGLKDYMEKEYAELTFFDVKEFYKGNSKLAIEFMQETHHFGETETLYLEMKSLLMTNPNQRIIPETIDYPIFYNNNILKKWVTHKSGAGLWYVFGYKFGNYKDVLQLNVVFERHKEKILTLANTIDNGVFETSSFNEVFFSKLWEYLIKDTIPKLAQYQSQIDRKTPPLIYYLYIVFLLLMVFGVLLPITYLMLNFSVVILIVGYSIIISTIFYTAITFHIFLSKEVKN